MKGCPGMGRSLQLGAGAFVRRTVGALLLGSSASALMLQLSPAPDSPERFGQVPAFTFTASNGERVTEQDLLGAPWIAVPFFVRCTGPCPSITTDLRAGVYPALEGSGARLVSFSLDPKFDSPETLREYAESFAIDPEQWLFLTGDAQAMVEFIKGGLKIPLEYNDPQTLAEGEQAIVHGTRLPVVDPQGQIAGWYEASRGSLDGGLSSAERNLELLLKRTLAVAGTSRTGSALPLLNAYLNGTAFLLLLMGWFAIRTGRREAHERLMKLAFVISALFLASYLTYHLGVQRQQGPTPYNGSGWRQTAYWILLISHVVLAIVNLPMGLRVFWLARCQDWERHQRLARKTIPIWLYVSLTGVLVYLMLYPWNPPPPG